MASSSSAVVATIEDMVDSLHLTVAKLRPYYQVRSGAGVPAPLRTLIMSMVRYGGLWPNAGPIGQPITFPMFLTRITAEIEHAAYHIPIESWPWNQGPSFPAWPCLSTIRKFADEALIQAGSADGLRRGRGGGQQQLRPDGGAG